MLTAASKACSSVPAKPTQQHMPSLQVEMSMSTGQTFAVMTGHVCHGQQSFGCWCFVPSDLGTDVQVLCGQSFIESCMHTCVADGQELLSLLGCVKVAQNNSDVARHSYIGYGLITAFA